MSDKMLVNEVAQLAGVSGDAVRLWERIGKLRAERTRSGVRLFDRADVEAFLRSRRGGCGHRATQLEIGLD